MTGDSGWLFWRPEKFSAGSKEIVTENQAEQYNTDGEEAVCDKEHDCHADTNPEKNKSK